MQFHANLSVRLAPCEPLREGRIKFRANPFPRGVRVPGGGSHKVNEEERVGLRNRHSLMTYPAMKEPEMSRGRDIDCSKR